MVFRDVECHRTEAKEILNQTGDHKVLIKKFIKESRTWQTLRVLPALFWGDGEFQNSKVFFLRPTNSGIRNGHLN